VTRAISKSLSRAITPRQGERKEQGVEQERLLLPGADLRQVESMINLPGGLELDKLEAHLHDGVLDIRSRSLRP